MKPFELATRRLPKTADKAEIKWSSSEGPRREGRTIILRLDEGMEFLPILDGKQFVCCYPSPRYSNSPSTWFGGTDENPFLTPLDTTDEEIRKGITALLNKGKVDTFFESLRPRRLVELEDRDEIGFRARRQGDIFALPIGWSWTELDKMADLLGLALDNEINDETNSEKSVFDTRHTIKGRITQVSIALNHSYSDSRKIETTLATGILEAPDHTPLKLTTVHALFQTHGLFDPKKAD